MNKGSGTLGNRFLTLIKNNLSIFGFILVWEAIWMINYRLDGAIINVHLFPAPHSVITTFKMEWEKGWVQEDFIVSMSRVFKGFAVAGIIGVTTGVVSGYFSTIRRIVNPIVDLFRPIPALAFMPMFLLFFGIGESSKVMFIAYGAFFNVYVNTYQAVLYTPPVMLRAAKCLGASRFQILYKVVLPNALPGIFTGLRLSFGLALFILVAAEMLAANAGLGFRVMDARTDFNTSVMITGAFMIGFIGLAFAKVFDIIEGFMLRWVEK